MPTYKLTTPMFDEHSIIVCCACGSEHQIQLTYYDDPDDWHLMVSIHLVHRGFFRRLWKAIRYTLGYRCRYGEWDELLLNRRDAEEIVTLLQSYVGKQDIQALPLE